MPDGLDIDDYSANPENNDPRFWSDEFTLVDHPTKVFGSAPISSERVMRVTVIDDLGRTSGDACVVRSGSQHSGWRNDIASVGASSLGEGGWRTRYWSSDVNFDQGHALGGAGIVHDRGVGARVPMSR